MTKIIGLTGGIGSGKTTVARRFEQAGFPVYLADDAGKRVMEYPQVQQAIVQALGEEVWNGKALDRQIIANKVFQDKAALAALNAIVHPAVAKDFADWCNQQNADYVIKEAAILFESGSYQACDIVITVVADENTRINRVMQRDGINEEQVRARMRNQWSDEEKIKRSDYIIRNDSFDEMEQQVEKIIDSLKKGLKNCITC